MAKYFFEQLSVDHKAEIIEIFNYYMKESTAAYRTEQVEPDFIHNFLEDIDDYPAYAIKSENDDIVGFCMLEPYMSLKTFSEVAEVTYFIDEKYTGQGIGALSLRKLESDALKKGITKLVVNISSDNKKSISFHIKQGFKECGKFTDIGKKFNTHFSIVFMEKNIS